MRRAFARGVGIALIALLVAILWMTWRAFELPSRQVAAEAIDTAVADADRTAHALARALRIPTISHSRDAEPDTARFLTLHAELERLFPRTHRTLLRERFHESSLLYTWPGSDPALDPLLLVAHLDVVPIDPGTEEAWTHPPFAGVVADGAVWGRGAIDDKGSLIAVMSAVETLLEEDYAPRRSVLLAFGHDEEIGGDRGARAIATALEERGVRPMLVLDEGGVVSEGMLPGLGAVALVGVAEKGSVSLLLTVDAPGGHSSIPPRQSAIGIVAQAVRALETRRPPARMVDTMRATLATLAPELPFLPRFALANADVLERPLLSLLARNEMLDATIRTSTAATVIHGGAKSNVLPKRVEATVNFRILPGETTGDVIAHARATIADERVRIDIAPGTPAREPTSEAPTDSKEFGLLQQTISARFPDALVTPYLVVGGTDARHYTNVSRNVYRFLPFRMDAEARTRMHGTDERVAIAELVAAVGFYRELIRRSGEAL